jgi:hypothetical protein
VQVLTSPFIFQFVSILLSICRCHMVLIMFILKFINSYVKSDMYIAMIACGVEDQI